MPSPPANPGDEVQARTRYPSDPGQNATRLRLASRVPRTRHPAPGATGRGVGVRPARLPPDPLPGVPMSRAFMQVDVFSAEPFLGNPVAVILDAVGLDAEQMQRIARWTNLSETTFVLPPDDPAADYRLRIFTPQAELPFAGHPTLGSAFAVRATGRFGDECTTLVQQCATGLVPLRFEGDGESPMPVLTLPQARSRALAPSECGALGAALGLPGPVHARAVDVGPVWITAELPTAQAVLALRPDMAAVAALSEGLSATGVTVFGLQPPGEDAAYEVRSFAPAHGVPEDPVCGSGNGCVAVYLESQGRAIEYTARQGRAIGRDGRIRVRPAGDRIELGGDCRITLRGTLADPSR